MHQTNIFPIKNRTAYINWPQWPTTLIGSPAFHIWAQLHGCDFKTQLLLLMNIYSCEVHLKKKKKYFFITRREQFDIQILQQMMDSMNTGSFCCMKFVFSASSVLTKCHLCLWNSSAGCQKGSFYSFISRSRALFGPANTKCANKGKGAVLNHN